MLRSLVRAWQPEPETDILTPALISDLLPALLQIITNNRVTITQNMTWQQQEARHNKHIVMTNYVWLFLSNWEDFDGNVVKCAAADFNGSLLISSRKLYQEGCPGEPLPALSGHKFNMKSAHFYPQCSPNLARLTMSYK